MWQYYDTASQIDEVDTADQNALILSLGNTGTALANAQLPHDLEAEGFRRRLLDKGKRHGRKLPVLMASGLPLDPMTHQNVSFSKDAVHYGAVVATCASLEMLGSRTNTNETEHFLTN